MVTSLFFQIDLFPVKINVDYAASYFHILPVVHNFKLQQP